MCTGVARREFGVVFGDEDPSREHREVDETTSGLWHPDLGEVSHPADWDFLPAGHDAIAAARIAGDATVAKRKS